MPVVLLFSAESTLSTHEPNWSHVECIFTETDAVDVRQTTAIFASNRSFLAFI